MHGLITIVLTQAELEAKTGGVNHARPANPGASPTFPVGVTIARTLAQIRDVFEASVKEFKLFHKTENALRKQIL
jgi:hypothetical protein